MQHELLFKAITHSTIGVGIVAVVLVLLIGIRKELNGGEPIRGLVHLGFFVMGLCTFLALMAALYSAQTLAVPEKISTNWIPPGFSNRVSGNE